MGSVYPRTFAAAAAAAAGGGGSGGGGGTAAAAVCELATTQKTHSLSWCCRGQHPCDACGQLVEAWQILHLGAHLPR